MKLLALDTSTEVMSIAVCRDDGMAPLLLQHNAAGGAKASAALIPAVLDLLQQAGLTLAGLDAICFGSGPGSFTGLRTACSVAQGLAFGAGIPVLPVNSLLAVAEDARLQGPSLGAPDAPLRVTALLDARMDEMYAATFAWDGTRWHTDMQSGLVKPEALLLSSAETAQTAGGVVPHWLAGNVFFVYGERLTAVPADAVRVVASPSAAAMLSLAPAMLRNGQACPPEQALPLYVRDKVAQTTAERAALKAASRPVA